MRPWACLTLLPIGCTSVATTGNRSTARPARRMGDLCRQVSWLTAQASLIRPSRKPNAGSQWHNWKETRRLQLRAQPRGRCCPHLTVFPLSHHALARAASPSQVHCRTLPANCQRGFQELRRTALHGRCAIVTTHSASDSPALRPRWARAMQKIAEAIKSEGEAVADPAVDALSTTKAAETVTAIIVVIVDELISARERDRS